MVVGLLIGILQTATSIQEQTLIFIPKILTVFLCRLSNKREFRLLSADL